MSLAAALVGHPHIVVTSADGEIDLELDVRNLTLDEAVTLLSATILGARIARRRIRAHRRKARKLDRLEKRTLRDFDADRAGASSLEVSE